jgi:hypothetical protein
MVQVVGASMGPLPIGSGNAENGQPYRGEQT